MPTRQTLGSRMEAGDDRVLVPPTRRRARRPRRSADRSRSMFLDWSLSAARRRRISSASAPRARRRVAAQGRSRCRRRAAPGRSAVGSCAACSCSARSRPRCWWERDARQVEIGAHVDRLHVGAAAIRRRRRARRCVAVAPVIEMPTVRPQHPREWPPSEQSLCHDTSEMPSSTPTFLQQPFGAVTFARRPLHHRVVGERADAREPVATRAAPAGSAT